jgi:hypothetical protein
VTYRRGGLTARLTAIEGKTDAVVDSQYGAIIIGRVQDWIVEVQDLLLGGERVEPRAGDQVEVEHGEATLRYEVQELSTGEAYRFHGPGRERVRIHTVYVGQT